MPCFSQHGYFGYFCCFTRVSHVTICHSVTRYATSHDTTVVFTTAHMTNQQTSYRYRSCAELGMWGYSPPPHLRLYDLSAYFNVVTNWELRSSGLLCSEKWFSLPTFRDSLSISSSLPLKMRPIGCAETSVRNYHYSLRNSPEEGSSHLLRGGSLKSRIDNLASHSEGGT